MTVGRCGILLVPALLGLIGGCLGGTVDLGDNDGDAARAGCDAASIDCVTPVQGGAKADAMTTADGGGSAGMGGSQSAGNGGNGPGGNGGNGPGGNGGNGLGVKADAMATAGGGGSAGNGGWPSAGDDGNGHDAAADGDAGGDAFQNVCGIHGDFRPRLQTLVKGLVGGPAYDGPAVVERSFLSELTLIFAPNSGGDAGADSGASTPRRLHLTGLDPMPLIPRGTRVWLSKSRAGEQAQSPSMYGQQPWAISIRAGQGGHLLLGAFYKEADDSAATPVRLGVVSPYCSTRLADGCAVDMTASYATAEILGDAPVTLHDSETGTVAMDGIPYSVRVTARDVTVGSSVSCMDFHVEDGVSLDIQASDMPSLVSGLPHGELPQCGAGNDPPSGLLFDVDQVSVGTTYEGPVYYLGRHPSYAGALTFSVPGLQGADTMPTLTIFGADGVFTEPALGRQFWLSYRLDGALFESENGPLVLASATFSADDAEKTAWVARMLGVSVRAEERCATGLDSWPVWDLVLGTNPPVRIGSGSAATVQLGGKSYQAWQWGEGGFQFEILPAK